MANQFAARIYGEFQGTPYIPASGPIDLPRVIGYRNPSIWDFPSQGVGITGLPTGYQMPSGSYVYSIIKVPPTGLNVHGASYLTDQSSSTLATAANA